MGSAILRWFVMGLGAWALQARAAGPIPVCVDLANPPFMSEASGKAVGVYPALIKEAFSAMGTKVLIDAKPWKRCLSELDDGITGVGGIYKNDERLQKYDFSEPIFVERMAVYFHKARPVEFANVASLVGLTVGVVRGWSYGDEFDRAVKDKKILVEDVTSDSQNFQKLGLRRLDVVLAIEEAGAGVLKSGQYPDIVASPKPLFENPTFLAFNKRAKPADLLARFNKALTDMKANGKLKRIGAAELGRS